MKRKLLSKAQINALDIVAFLETLGYSPKRVSFPHYWYLSPLRDEKTASFKVNKKINAWWDFGIQKGGNLVKFLSLYYGCAADDVPETFCRTGSTLIVPRFQLPKQPVLDNSIKNLSIGPLTALPLLRYIAGRRILHIVAQIYCLQATYTIKDKQYYAIAFSNRSGGYELRNQYFKGSTSPKDITLISNQSSTLSVFEGFTDFLSIQTALYGLHNTASDYLILNTLSFLSACQSVILSYSSVLLYLDNDPAGDKATATAISWNSTISDRRTLYALYKDPNDWLCHIGAGGIRYSISSS